MADKNDKKPPTDNNPNNKKQKVSQTDKYYKIKADFGYLASYNYKITKEIGRGGYGVVYKVNTSLCRPLVPRATLIKNMQSRSISTQFLVS